MVAETHNAPSVGVDERVSRLEALNFGLDWVLAPLAAVAVLGAIWATLGLGDPDAAGVFIRLYAPAVLVLGGVLTALVVRGSETDQRPWQLIGGGLALVGVGSAIRSFSELDWFALPDVDVVSIAVAAGLVLASAGAIRVPRLDGITHSRFRASLDGLAGGVAVGILTWEILRDDVSRSATASFWVQATLAGAFAVVVASFVFVLMRQERYRSDLAFRFALGAVVAMLMAVIVSRLLAEPGFGSPEVQIVELVAGALVMLSVTHLRRPQVVRDSPTARVAVWKLAVPYLPVIAMMGITFYAIVTGSTNLGLLPLGLMAVTATTGLRQIAAARESRELVALERDQLIIAVSHELSTPLTAVAGFSDLLSHDWADLAESERDEMVGIIQHQSKYLTGMVTDMVSLVRDQLHTVELDLARLDGKQIIADAVRSVFDLNVGPLPVKAQVEPYLEVVGDEMRLHQILVSMLKNAQRYGGGKVLIIAKREVDWRLIEVHDNGPGLPPKHAAGVWDRFERGENDLNASLPGSGLGLSMVHSLAEAHGGIAEYRQSEKLGGACFSIRLPMDRNSAVTHDFSAVS